MLRAILGSLQIVFGFLGQGWTDLADGPTADSGHEMDPNG
jgi:hypothetical protein